MTAREWWRDAVVYQVYPRSFQDTDGDGVGDLPGVIDRLDHVARLGADAIWLSPINPSPLADFGYDVSDYMAVDPRLGTLEDVDRLVTEAHRRGIRLLLDLVASHTSIEHPWFRAHPHRYIWSDDGPANNWRASFGGSAWSRDPASRRWYLHSFFSEQPDLNWRNPEVAEAIGEVVRFWLDRGVDGFRLDAVDRLIKDADLRDDPPARDPYPIPLHPEHATLDHRYSRDQPDAGIALSALREAAGDALLVAEAWVPTSRLDRYLDHVDLAFCFEFMHAARDAEHLRTVISAGVELERCAWVLSNHDFSRVASRWGAQNAHAAALLLLTLPGPAFVYQGDEVGMEDGPAADPPLDRLGRDAFRTPMPWEPGPGGGFTTGTPWLPLAGPGTASVVEQDADESSMLSLYRRLIALRSELGGGFRLLSAPDGVLAYERGSHVVAINLGRESRRCRWEGEVVITTAGGRDPRTELSPGAGLVVRVA